VDALLYTELVERHLLPRLKELRQSVWDAANGCSDYSLHIQHDGAPGHRAEGIEAYLNTICLEVRGEWVRQPAKSPCCNMLDMAVFHSISSIVARTDYTSKEMLHVAVESAFKELPAATLEMEWACKACLPCIACCAVTMRQGSLFPPTPHACAYVACTGLLDAAAD
jgi:hypothetical protein